MYYVLVDLHTHISLWEIVYSNQDMDGGRYGHGVMWGGRWGNVGVVYWIGFNIINIYGMRCIVVFRYRDAIIMLARV